MLHLERSKLIIDPVHGFITLRDPLIFKVINHAFFQRLRRIKQLGLTDFVYPGAHHTRFHHAIGAMHLTQRAMDLLREKGTVISNEEYQGTSIAILLHDVGHGPFSHALERTILHAVAHESISEMLMNYMNQEFEGALDLAIAIFKDQYERPFFHQLVSGQLDMDRLDYLQRDAFFTGVTEGRIGGERIIKILCVINDVLTAEYRGVYSIEHFLNARRMMYWQVYLHKTTVSAEQVLTQAIRRAKDLVQEGQEVPTLPAFKAFLSHDVTLEDFYNQPEYVRAFAKLDDYDIWASLKYWQDHNDPILSLLAQMMLTRNLFRTELANEPHRLESIMDIRERLVREAHFEESDLDYLINSGEISNAAYVSSGKGIQVLMPNGSIADIAAASDLPNIKTMTQIVKKYYLSYPKFAL